MKQHFIFSALASFDSHFLKAGHHEKWTTSVANMWITLNHTGEQKNHGFCSLKIERKWLLMRNRRTSKIFAHFSDVLCDAKCLMALSLSNRLKQNKTKTERSQTKCTSNESWPILLFLRCWDLIERERNGFSSSHLVFELFVHIDGGFLRHRISTFQMYQSSISMLNLSKFWKMASIKIIAKLLPTAYTRTDKLLKEHIHSMWLSNQMKLQLCTSVILDSMSNRWKPEWQHSTVQPITGLNVYQVWWTSAQNMKISRWFICITKNRRMSVRNSCNADITWRYSLSYRIYGIGSVI